MQELLIQKWSMRRKFFFRLFFIFSLLLIISIPYEYSFLPSTGKILAPFSEWLTAWTGKTFFHFNATCTYKIASDTAGFYLLVLDVFCIAFLAAMTWSLVDKKRLNYVRLQYWFYVVIRFYLALMLFIYGFNKVFKWQFYSPEPNTLYTTIGEAPRDFLYWTSMGTSRMYSVFTGSAELLAALLLLFRRTYVAGAFFSFLLLVNIVLLNFSFDISVKLFSLFLLFLSLLLIRPHLGKIISFFTGRNKTTIETWKPVFRRRGFAIGKRLFKLIIVVLIVVDPLWHYIRSKNFNDDLVQRPPLHGAYEVELFEKNSDQALRTDPSGWKRVFIHRQDYFIVQRNDDEMQSFPLFADTSRHVLMIGNPKVHCYLNYYKAPGNDVSISGNFFGDTIYARLKKTDLDKLPLMQKEFHWMIDN